MPSSTAFALVLLLSLAQFFSDRINIERSRYRDYLSSFAAAIAITYLLFHFLPKAYTGSSGLLLFLPLISGFLLIYILEKVFYAKYAGRFSIKKVKTYHDELHTAILFLYHFVIGAVLLNMLEADLLAGIFFLPPLLMFSTIGNWSLHHTYLQQVPYRRLLLASSTVLGALFAKTSLSAPAIETALVNFAAGILLFIIVRESLPQKKEGKPFLFILGVLIYGAMMLLLKQI